MVYMKKSILILLISSIILMTACSQKTETSLSVEQPQNISTGDEIYPALNENSVEQSTNVNGMRFTITLPEFTQKYNEKLKNIGITDILVTGHWQKNSETQRDSNGVEIQYYYYDGININFTATVEVESGKLMNIGCGTTMKNFVAQTDNQNNSDLILKKCAVMAEAVCQFPSGSTDVLQDIFYRTTIESIDSLWYQGFIFSLSTQENKSSVENNIMLFRVFPVTDELKNDWNVADYEAYSASVPIETNAVSSDE